MWAKYKEWLLAAAILAVTFAAFSPAVNHDFVNWDDDVNVTQNPNVKELNGTTLKNMFTGEVIGGYTPLTTLSFAIENALFGMKPGVFHTTNILLHLIVTLLIYILVRRLGFSLFAAAVTALLFGIHPMRVESVAWVTERKDLLYSLFFLLSVITYLSYRNTRRLYLYILSLALFVFSLMSKIQAVTLPLVLILIDYLKERKFTLAQWGNKIPFLVFSLVTGVAGILLLSERGSLEVDTALPFFQRIFVGTFSFCIYLLKVVIPYPLSAIYPMPPSLSAAYYISAVVLLGMIWAVWRYLRHNREVVFGILFFLVNVVFMLQVVGAGTAFLADRFTYLAYAGLFLILALLAEKLLTHRLRLAVLIPGALWVLMLLMITFVHVRVWENSETLFTDVVKKYPGTLIAHNNLGFYYREQGRNEKAIESYTRAIESNPEEYLAYSNRGEVWFELGDSEKALADLNRSIELKPDNSKALSNRAAIYGSRRQYDLALADLDKAVELDPANLRALSNRLLAYYSLAQYDKALRDADAYLALQPTDSDILNQRGLCLGMLNRDPEALADFNEAIRLNPGKGNYYRNRSYQYSKMGNFRAALQDILKARDLGLKINEKYLGMLQERVSSPAG